MTLAGLAVAVAVAFAGDEAAATGAFPGLDQELDRVLASAADCLADAASVDRYHSQRIAFELRWTVEGTVRAKALWPAEDNPRLVPCLAPRLTGVPLRAAPYLPAAAWVLVTVRGDRLERDGPSFLAPPHEREDASTRAALSERFAASWVWRKLQGMGPRCLQVAVVDEGEDASMRIRAGLRVLEDGRSELTPGPPAGKGGEIERCVLEELRGLRFPPGFAGTPALSVEVRVRAEGGEYASGAANRYETTWSWRYRVVTRYSGDSDRRRQVGDDVLWLAALEDRLAEAEEEFVACLMNEVQPGWTAELHAWADADAVGGEWRTPSQSSMPAACLATVIEGAVLPIPVGARGFSLRLELLPDHQLLLTAPVPEVVAPTAPPTVDVHPFGPEGPASPVEAFRGPTPIEWGSSRSGGDGRTLIAGPRTTEELRSALAQARSTARACLRGDERPSSVRGRPVLLDLLVTGDGAVEVLALWGKLGASETSCVTAAYTAADAGRESQRRDARVLWPVVLAGPG